MAGRRLSQASQLQVANAKTKQLEGNYEVGNDFNSRAADVGNVCTRR
jgi:hypothetical protein